MRQCSFITQLNEETVERAKAYLMSVKEGLQAGLKDRKLTITWSVALDTDAADAIIGTVEQREQQEGSDSHEVSKRAPLRPAEGSYGCDLIAMSTHGRSGLQRWVMGSVMERVLGATRLPMLIVRPQNNG